MKNTLKKLVDAFVSNASKGTIACTLALTLGLAGAASAATVEVNSASALASAISSAAAGDTIKLTANITQSISVSKTLTLDLNGCVLESSGGRVILVSGSGNLTVIDSSPDTVHYYTVGSNGLWTWNDSSSSGAVPFENLTERPTSGIVALKGGAITGGKADGGAIYANGSGATLNLQGGNIVGNRTASTSVGSIEWGAAVKTDWATFNMSGGNIVGNALLTYGKGVGLDSNGGTLNMTGGSICFNSAVEAGAGIGLRGGAKVNMTGGSIRGNYDGWVGCGIYAENNDGFVSVGGTAVIAGNKAGTSESNVRLKGSNLITVLTGDDAPQASMKIGVYNDTLPTRDNPVAITGENGADYAANFFSDNATLFVTNDLNTVKLYGHIHCLCGDDACTAEGHTHTDLTWSPWTSTTALPDTAGNWYLTNDVTLAAAYVPVTGVNLCLNGHVVKQTTAGQRVITVNSDITFALTDCDQATTHNFKVGSNGLWTLTDEAATTTFEQLSDRPAANAVVAVKGGCLTGGATTGVLIVDGDGGGMSSAGVISMFGGNIVGNSASNMGGGVGLHNGGDFVLMGGRILGNVGGSFGGGGVSVNGDNKRFTMKGGLIAYNTASEGAGISTGGGFIMTDGLIVGNYATSAYGYGGGVEEWGETYSDIGTIITGGVISNNTAHAGGAGVYVWNSSGYIGRLTLGGDCRITDNTVGGAANNVLLAAGRTIIITNSPAFTNNAAIGVFTETKPGAPVAFTSNGSEDDLDFFTSDEGYFTRFNTDHLELVAKVEVLPTPVANTTTKVYVNGEELASVGGKYYVASNSTDEIVVSYIADSGSGYFFADKTTVSNVTLEAGAAATDPATMPAAQIPAAPTVMPSVTVSFVMNGHGEQIPDQQVAIGGKVYLESEPEDEDKDFVGWYAETELLNLFDLDAVITEAKVLYAGWTKKVVRPVRPSDDGYSTPVTYNGDTNVGVRVSVADRDLFLGNDFIELGLYRNGAFGSYATAPSNFHYADDGDGGWHSQNGRIGLRASKSGWETGDDPKGKYTSDFFLPGTVDEGWLLTVGGVDSVRAQSGCLYGNEKNLSGTPVLSMKITGTPGTSNETICAKTVVQTTQGFEIEQVVSLSKYDTGYDTWVTIRNTSAADKANVCYTRAFDPDQGWGTVRNSNYSDNFYHTEENGDVYVLASATPSNLASPTTLNEMFAKADGAFFFFAPLFDYDYTVTPTSQKVGWSTASQFTEPVEGFHEWKDWGMSVRMNLGTIPAGGETTLYYYSSLDPIATRALEKIRGKGAGDYIPAPVFTSVNVKDDVIRYNPGDVTADVTLWETNATTAGRFYLVTKKCTTLEQLATAENQLVSGKLSDADGNVTFTVPAVENGPYYAYYVDAENSVSLAKTFYIAPYETYSIDLTFDANGSTFADGSTVTNVAYSRWTYTVKPDFEPVVPEGCLFVGWFTDAACTTAFKFGERLATPTTVYACYRQKTGLFINGKDIAVDLSSDVEDNQWAYDEDNHVWRVYSNYSAYLSGSSSNTTLDVVYPNGSNYTYFNGVTVDAREMSAIPLVQSSGRLYFNGDNAFYSAAGIPAMVVTNRYSYTLEVSGSGSLSLYPGEGADALLLQNVKFVIYSGPTFNREELKQYVYGVRTSYSCCAPFDNGDGTWTAARANWIVFDQQGIGETVTNVVKYYSYFTVPETPTAEGYTFAGWYKDSACTQTNTSCYANAYYDKQWTITLYAKWNADVVFDAAGGQFADGTLEKASPVEFRSTYVLPTETPTREGYTFLGWYAGVTNGAPEVTAATSYPTLQANTIFAKWQATAAGVTTALDGTPTADGLGLADVCPTAAGTDGDLVIPDRADNTLNSTAVVSIARYAFTPKQYEKKYAAPAVTSVTLPTFVTEIGSYAFYLNASLANVTFAPVYDYVTGEKATLYIRDYAFANTALTNLVFPAGGSYKLGHLAFAHNPMLKDVWVYGKITIESLDKSPFREVGEGLGSGEKVNFHLSPSQALDADFVAALTNGVNAAHVIADVNTRESGAILGEVPVSTSEITFGDPIVVDFTLPEDAPWQTVTTETVYFLWAENLADLTVEKGETLHPFEVTPQGGRAYRAKFAKPAASSGFFRLFVGD